MEFLFEGILETLIDGALELWTDFKKRKNPYYDNTHVKKLFIVIIGILLAIVVTVLFIGFFFLVESIAPNAFDIIGFD